MREKDEMQTITYYDQNASAFSESTLEVDFTETQDRFAAYLPQEGLVLDFGCGSGRDTICFLKKGFAVEAVDGSEQICSIASKNIGLPVRQMLFLELREHDRYDGIWACASILHLNKEELKIVLEKMVMAVKPGGYMYASFKYGDFEGLRNGRYFTDFTESSFRAFLQRIRKRWTGAVCEG